MSEVDSTQNAPCVEYRDIPGFPGYRIGSDGSVWSQYRKGNNKGGAVRREEWKRLSHWIDAHGYPNVSLGTMQHAKKKKKVHRLMLEVFVGPCPEGCECCHRSNDRTNFSLDNIYWGTRQDNATDRVRHGTSTGYSRESCRKPRTSPEDVREIRRLAAEGVRQIVIARQFDLSTLNTGRIIRRLIWKDVQ